MVKKVVVLIFLLASSNCLLGYSLNDVDLSWSSFKENLYVKGNGFKNTLKGSDFQDPTTWVNAQLIHLCLDVSTFDKEHNINNKGTEPLQIAEDLYTKKGNQYWQYSDDQFWWILTAIRLYEITKSKIYCYYSVRLKKLVFFYNG